MHASTWPIDLKDPAAEVRTHSPERELVAGGTWDHNLSAALNLNDKTLSSPEPHTCNYKWPMQSTSIKMALINASGCIKIIYFEGLFFASQCLDFL